MQTLVRSAPAGQLDRAYTEGSSMALGVSVLEGAEDTVDALLPAAATNT